MDRRAGEAGGNSISRGGNEKIPVDEWGTADGRSSESSFWRPTALFLLIELQIYASPWQPEFCLWAFNYPCDVDRFNPSPAVSKLKVSNPIPSWPQIDVMLTHGPPYGILDMTKYNQVVGCKHLRRAVARCRPRLHCFGHIHEGWGGEKLNWLNKKSERFEIDSAKVIENRSAFVDLSESGNSPLKFGEETLFVNASIMDVVYRPRNAPWVVDLDLPCSGNEMNADSMEDVEYP